MGFGLSDVQASKRTLRLHQRGFRRKSLPLEIERESRVFGRWLGPVAIFESKGPVLFNSSLHIYYNIDQDRNIDRKFL